MKNKIFAGLLAFFGGVVGLHKFYLRDPGAGVFYIFLTFMTADFFPIPLILGIIDAMRYFMMPQEEFDRKFNKQYYRHRPFQKPTSNRSQKDYYEVNKRPETKGFRQIKNNPFKKSGVKKYKEFEIEEAIEDFKKGLKIEPKDVALHFNLACAYALMENKTECFYYLEQTVALGMDDYNKILTHDDLAFLRIQPEFEAFKINGFKRTPEIIKEEKGAELNAETESKPMNDLLLAQLNRLMELRKKGVLTEQEFVVERKKILVN